MDFITMRGVPLIGYFCVAVCSTLFWTGFVSELTDRVPALRLRAVLVFAVLIWIAGTLVLFTPYPGLNTLLWVPPILMALCALSKGILKSILRCWRTWP